MNRANEILRGRNNSTRPAVDLVGRARAEALAGIGVDRVDDPDRGRVVGILQFEHRAQFVGEAGELVLDDRAVRNAACGRHALRQRLALADGVEAGHRDRALRARVDRSIGRLKLGEQQRSAHQRRRVAEGRDGDVEPRGRLHSCGEIRGDDDRGDIAVAERGAVDVKTQVREHRLDGLLGERRVAQGVAGPLQTNHEAIADKLSVARAAQDRDILDPGRKGRRGGEAKRER